MKYTVKVALKAPARNAEISTNNLDTARQFIKSYGGEVIYGLITHADTDEIVACYNYDAAVKHHFEADYIAQVEEELK